MALKNSIHDRVPLPGSEATIPRLGYGVYKSVSCKQSVLTALSLGYRHIDTAELYKNEAEVGEAVRESGIPRNELYLVTKIRSPVENDIEKTLEVLREAVAKIDEGSNGKKGYVDLYLIHNPRIGRESREILWRALEQLKEEGLTVDIGVSNYGIKHLAEMEFYSSTVPVCDQVEAHPFCQQRELSEYCKSKGILVTAYAPIARNRRSDNPTLIAIGQKYGKQATQVMIKWNLQNGYLPLPKSDDSQRMTANMDMDGWELSDEDMTELMGLDEGEKGAVCPYSLNLP